MHSLTLHEQMRHGSPEFPVAYYYVDHKHPRYQMPFHWHREWELLRILDGSFQIHIDDDEYLAQAGDVLLFCGGSLHGGTPKNCTYECLLFDLHSLFRSMEIVKKDLRPFYKQECIPYPFFPEITQPDICRIVGEGMNAFAHEACRELEVIGCISRLFSTIRKNNLYIQDSCSEYNSAHRIDQIKSVLDHVETHYGDPLRLETLAQVAGMNPKYFCRIFRSVTNYSPMDYVNFYRIERAAYLLVSSSLPITTIGLECGFTETSYFTKVFRKYKGTSPRQYRMFNKN